MVNKLWRCIIKKRSSALAAVLVLIMSISLLSFSGCGSDKEEAKKTAEGFLKATYEVKDYKHMDEFEAFITDNKLDENLLTNEGIEDATKFREKLNKIYYGDTLDLISEKLKTEGTLLSDRLAPLSFEMKAKVGSYTTEVKNIELKEAEGATASSVNYSYTLALEIKNSDGTTSEEEKLGNINMIKEDGKWVVDYLKSAN